MKNTNFFDLSEIEVTLTYPQFGITEPIRFGFAILLSAKEKELRQTFFALTPEEQEAKRPAYNLDLLCSLATKHPENLPTYDPADKKPAEALREFFEGNNAMKQKVVEDAISVYFAKTQPAEFFR